MQLVINTYGSSLRRKGDRFVVKAGEREVAFSAQKVQSIVIATGAHFSSNVVQLASQHNVDIVFLDKQGNPTARIWQTRMGSRAAIRRRQIEAAETDDGLRFVRDWTTSKLDNQNAFLKELQQRRPVFDSPLKTLTGSGGERGPRLLHVPGARDARRAPIYRPQPTTSQRRL